MTHGREPALGSGTSHLEPGLGGDAGAVVNEQIVRDGINLLQQHVRQSDQGATADLVDLVIKNMETAERNGRNLEEFSKLSIRLVLLACNIQNSNLDDFQRRKLLGTAGKFLTFQQVSEVFSRGFASRPGRVWEEVRSEEDRNQVFSEIFLLES